MPKVDLDAIDRRIVAELQSDGRLSNVDLADKIGLSPSPCLRRVKRLEQDGYIEGYRAALRRDRVACASRLCRRQDRRSRQRARVGVSKKPSSRCRRSSPATSSPVRRTISSKSSCLTSTSISISDRQAAQYAIVREVRSNIAIQTLKAGARLPLTHLE